MSRNQFEGGGTVVTSGGGSTSVTMNGDVIGSSAANVVQSLTGTAGVVTIPDATGIVWGTAASSGTKGYVAYPHKDAITILESYTDSSGAAKNIIATGVSGGTQITAFGDFSFQDQTIIVGKDIELLSTGGNQSSLTLSDSGTMEATFQRLNFLDPVGPQQVAYWSATPTTIGFNIDAVCQTFQTTYDQSAAVGITGGQIEFFGQDCTDSTSTGGNIYFQAGQGGPVNGSISFGVSRNLSSASAFQVAVLTDTGGCRYSGQQGGMGGNGPGSDPFRFFTNDFGMADADAPLTQSYSDGFILSISGIAFTADRTLTLYNNPGQVRCIKNGTGASAFKLLIAPAVGDLSTNGIANGKSALIYCNSSGNWERASADVTP